MPIGVYAGDAMGRGGYERTSYRFFSHHSCVVRCERPRSNRNYLLVTAVALPGEVMSNAVTDVPEGTICNECLYPATVVYLCKYLCYRCYSFAVVPPSRKQPILEVVSAIRDERQYMLPLTGTGR